MKVVLPVYAVVVIIKYSPVKNSFIITDHDAVIEKYPLSAKLSSLR